MLAVSGLVTIIADAIDIRGPQGAQGLQGLQGISGTDGVPGMAGTDGENGWVAQLAIVSDSQRRVLQLQIGLVVAGLNLQRGNMLVQVVLSMILHRR